MSREADIRERDTGPDCRMSDLQKLKVSEGGHWQSKMFKCSRCGRLYQEKSRYCPRCDTKSMGELRNIPDVERERHERNAWTRLKRKWEG